MANFSRFLCAAAFLVTAANPVFAQWVHTNGPYGTHVTCLTRSGTDLFAGTVGDGVFLSTNDGSNWIGVNTGLPTHWYDSTILASISCFATMGSHLFAGTSDGVFLTDNRGASWMNRSSGLPTDAHIQALAASGTDLYAAIEGSNAVFFSADEGATWTPVNNVWGWANVNVLAVSGRNVFAVTYDHIYWSSNKGVSWRVIDSGLTNTHIAALAISDTNLFVGNADGIFRSTNNGTSWTAVNSGLTETDIHTLTIYGSKIYAATDSGIVFLSTNNGTNWTKMSTGLPPQNSYTSFAASGSSLFAGASSGVFRSNGIGSTWEAVNAGLHYLDIGSIAVIGPNIFIDGIYCSTDTGSTWNRCAMPGGTLAVHGSYLFSGMYWKNQDGHPLGTTRYGPFRSSDNGKSWTQIKAGLPYLPSVTAFAFSDTIMFVAADGVYLSTDDGDHWKAASSGLPGGEVHTLAVSGGAIFAGTDTGIYRSKNNGTTWAPVDSRLPNGEVQTFAVSGSTLYAGTRDAGVYRSTNNGNNWNAVNTGLPTHAVVTALAASGNYLFAGIDGSGVFISTSDGVEWTAINDGMATKSGVPRVNAFAVFRDDLYAATSLVPILNFEGNGGGVWRRPLSEIITAVDNSSRQLPAQFRLEQNYPNPFNPTTTIRYQLPEAGHVSLTVYDLLGREVAPLVNGMKQPGTYTVQWDASGMPSGVYLCRFRSGAFTQTRKLIVVR